jgi:hydroxymethylpyrimidine/phosphomethylpyrimidine kinase
MTHSRIPVVLAIGGHDPSGGAGIQADSEAIAALGCHATSAITCLTVQDSCNVQHLAPVDPELLIAQAEAVLSDFSISAIKIGLIGDAAIARALAQLLERYPAIPVILDPVLAAGGGTDLASEQLEQTLLEELLPQIDLLTPNSEEARRLTGLEPLDECAQALLERGCKHVLITGAHEQGSMVINGLYDTNGLMTNWEWERLPGEYHGSGCTLAAAISALLARGLTLMNAVREGQEYAWQALAHGRALGQGQLLPNRLYRQEQQ